MLNLICKIQFHNGRFSCISSFSSAHKFFLLQLNQLSSSAANSPKHNSEDSNQDSFSATYLKNTLGFSPERALMYSKYLNFDSPKRPDSVIAFFKNHHFTDAQILLLVRKWPVVFKYLPETNFLPKLEFFQSLGFSSSDIVKILTLAPDLLGRSLEAQIIPCVDFLRSFFTSDKDVMFSIMRFPGIFVENLQDTLLPNVGILSEAGVPESHVAALLKISSRRIAIDPEIFRETVQEVQKLGLNPRKKIFIRGIIVMRELSCATWKEKIKLYKSWGWSEHQVLDAFRKHPRIMAASHDKISRIMDLFANKMACDFSVLLRRPQILSLGFEKTIAPRCAFYQVLLSKGLIKQDSSLAAMLECPQRLFLARYVLRFKEEAPELLKLYQETLSASKE
ncbi:hypothetical protein Pfo_026079 [Paulownia fortunei]|nr:hypothetical protein Pfo_026079 [Paulownia fortunei]